MGTYGKGGAMGAHLSPVTSLPSFLLGMKDRAPASTEWSIWSDSYIRLTMILAAPPSEDSTLAAMKLAEMAEQAFKFMEHQRSESTQPNYQPRWLTLYSDVVFGRRRTGSWEPSILPRFLSRLICLILGSLAVNAIIV